MFCFFGKKKDEDFLSCCNLLNHPSLFYYFITTQKGYCREAIVANIINFYTVVGEFLHNSDFLPSKTCKLSGGYELPTKLKVSLKSTFVGMLRHMIVFHIFSGFHYKSNPLDIRDQF